MSVFTSTTSFTDAQIAAAHSLEPAFEHLLRKSMTHESIITTLRVNDIHGRCLPHKREFARVVTAWKTANVLAETKLQTDAVARAHGVRVTLLPCDWMSILKEFKKKYGNHIADDRLLAQSMFEHFSEKLADGTLEAEPLSDVVSQFEEEQQELKKPEPARQHHFQARDHN